MKKTLLVLLLVQLILFAIRFFVGASLESLVFSFGCVIVNAVCLLVIGE